MRDSTTYQAILKEGFQEGRREVARRFLLRRGARRFGEPDAAIIAAIESIHDIDRLESLTDRLVDATASDWNDLLRDSIGNPAEYRGSARGTRAMNESTIRPTEQQIQALKESMTRVMLEGNGRIEGRHQEAKRLLYLLGIRRFGQPGPTNVAAVSAIRETDDLEAVCLRIIDPDVRTWEDALRNLVGPRADQEEVTEDSIDPDTD
jgi:hypothetical protein